MCGIYISWPGWGSCTAKWQLWQFQELVRKLTPYETKKNLTIGGEFFCCVDGFFWINLFHKQYRHSMTRRCCITWDTIGSAVISGTKKQTSKLHMNGLLWGETTGDKCLGVWITNALFRSLFFRIFSSNVTVAVYCIAPCCGDTYQIWMWFKWSHG